MLRCPLEQHGKLVVVSSVVAPDSDGCTYLLTVKCGKCGAFAQMGATTDSWTEGLVNNSREIFKMSARSIAFNHVVEIHHSTEARARMEARKLVTRLQRNSQQALAREEEFLHGYWLAVGVASDHMTLASSIVREMLKVGG